MDRPMRPWALILGLGLVSGGCARLRTDPEPVAALPARSPDAAVPAPKAERPLSLRESVERAMQHVPALRAARARADGAAAGIDLADTAWLPRIDFVWQ